MNMQSVRKLSLATMAAVALLTLGFGTSASAAVANGTPDSAPQQLVNAHKGLNDCGPADQVWSTGKKPVYQGCKEQVAPATTASTTPAQTAAATMTQAGEVKPDDAVVESRCAPKYQSRDAAGRYIGCTLPKGTPQELRLMGPKGEMVVLSGSESLATFGTVENIRLVMKQQEQACHRLMHPSAWREVWEVARPVLGIGTAVAGGIFFGPVYGGIIGAEVLTNEVDHLGYVQDTEDWKAMSIAWCGSFDRWKTDVEPSTQAAPPMKADPSSTQQPATSGKPIT